MSEFNLRQIDKFVYEIPPQGLMKVPGRIYLNQPLLDQLDTNVLTQVSNVASLPGILKYSLAMPDAHWGYGFPIGGVAAFPAESGIISPGGIGYDINCGIRMLKTNLNYHQFKSQLKPVTDQIFQEIPMGLGRGGLLKTNRTELIKILDRGCPWLVEQGIGDSGDISHCEDRGSLEGAEGKLVSPHGVDRGLSQLGSLGSGNHFIELGIVDQVYSEKLAHKLGLKNNDVVVSIHTGSRGLGHQITTDWVRTLGRYVKNQNIELPDRQLIYTPLNSSQGKNYLQQMQAGANYAFANRHLIAHRIRKIIEKRFKKSAQVELVYDCCHNIAKIENHFNQKVIVHRKGATRAFSEKSGIGLPGLGTPVIIPGSMSTGSYLLIPTVKCEQTFASLAHGAGRLLSRKKAKQAFHIDKIQKILLNNSIYFKFTTESGFKEEAPGAYKSLTDVVNVIVDSGLGELVLRTKPVANIKG